MQEGGRLYIPLCGLTNRSWKCCFQFVAECQMHGRWHSLLDPTTRQIQAHLLFRTQKYLYVMSQFCLILALSGAPRDHLFMSNTVPSPQFDRQSLPLCVPFLCQMRPNRDISTTQDIFTMTAGCYLCARRPITCVQHILGVLSADPLS